jgi:uncharacterized protein YuzE
MKVLYDPHQDILQIGLVLDYDEDANVIGLEIRKASTKVDSPCTIAYLVGAANTEKPQPNGKD